MMFCFLQFLSLLLLHSTLACNSNSWSTGPSLPLGSGECAGAVINDMMYFAGEANTDTYVFNFTSNEWGTVAQRIHPGNHHASVVYKGEWWLVGGIDADSYGTVQVYNPEKNQWTSRASLPWDGGSICLALIHDTLYACGGIVGFEGGKKKGGTRTTNECAYYNLTTGEDKWTSFPSMPEGRNHAAVVSDGSKMWVFGGRMKWNYPQNGFPTVQVYDPNTNSWDQSYTPMPVGRGGTGHAVYSYYHKKFYVFGGETGDSPLATPNFVFNRTDIYDPQTNSWSRGEDMPQARHGIFPLLYEGEVHIVAGGWHHGYAVSTTYQKYCL